MYKDLKLTASNGYVCVTGNMEVIRTVNKIDGAKESTLRDTNGKLTGIAFVYFPPTRKSIMAVESLCVPTSITDEYVTLRNQTMRISVPQYISDDNTLLARPMMQHQLEFVAFAMDRRGSYNGSEQGTGKTMTACYLVDMWKAPINIVLCPSSLMLQWKTEFESLYYLGYAVDNYNIIVLNHPSVEKRIDALKFCYDGSENSKQNIIITNYESLTKLQVSLELLIGVENYSDPNRTNRAVIIADEAWKIKNPTSKASIAARSLAKYCQHLLALSGTPVCQGVSDLWAQLDFITSTDAERMMTLEVFCARYEVPTFTYLGNRKIPKPGPCSDPMGLMDLLGDRFYRATKATSLDLPEKFATEKVILEFPPTTRRVYDAVKRDGLTALDPMRLDGGGNTMIRLQQICGGWIYNTQSDEQRVIMEFDEDSIDMEEHLIPIASPKIAWMEDFVTDVLLPNPQMRCIVWFKFNAELFDIYERTLSILGQSKVVKIHGDDKYTAEELETVKTSFNNKDPEGVQLICGQISKLAFGHNLQGGDINIYYSHTHRYVLKAQSADRTHRMGRIGGVRYIELVVANSIDEEIVAATDGLHDFNIRLAPDTTSSMETI